MEYIIEDKKWYSNTFIKELRDVLAHHDHPERVLDGHPNPVSVSTFNNPALLARKRCRRWPARLIHIKLQLAKEETSTTLAVRDDNVHLIGFMNQKGVWYDLGELSRDGKLLPAEYNSETLKWGPYIDILGIRDMFGSFLFGKDKNVSGWDEVREKMGTEGLGKDFAMKAVRTLSRYPDVEEGECSKRALVGLMIMVCESARLNPVHKHIEDVWEESRTGFPKQLMEYIRCSDFISEILVRWKDLGCNDDGWPDGLLAWPFTDNVDYCNYVGRALLDMEINGPKDALAAAHLVLNPKKLESD